MSRQGLVKKQVQVTKNGKTFTQTVWVKASQDPKGSDGLTNLDPDKAKEFQSLQELFKTDKASGLEKLKTMGVTWEENPHPAINLMRAKVAMKQYFGISASKPDGTQQDAPNKTNQDLIAKLESMGVSWKENQHPAINLMRAKMAAKKAGIDLSELEKDQNKKPTKDLKEEKKKLKQEYLKRRAKNRDEFKKKVELFAEDLNESQSKAVRTVGIMATDDASRDYIQNFLSKRYVSGLDKTSFADYSFKPSIYRLLDDLVPDLNEMYNASETLRYSVDAMRESLTNRRSTYFGLGEVSKVATGFLRPEAIDLDEPSQEEPLPEKNFDKFHTSREATKELWEARFKKFKSKIALTPIPEVRESQLEYIEKLQNAFAKTDYNPLIIKSAFRTVKGNYDGSSNVDIDEDYEIAMDRVGGRIQKSDKATDEHKELVQDLYEFKELGIEVAYACYDVVNDPTLRDMLTNSANIEQSIARALYNTQAYKDGKISISEIVESSACILEDVDYKYGDGNVTSNAETLQQAKAILTCIDSFICMTQVGLSQREKIWEKYDNLKQQITSPTEDELVAKDFSGCNSLIRTLDEDHRKEIEKRISADFDRKHAVKDYKILNVFEIVDLPNVDETYSELRTKRGEDTERRLYHGTGSFATAAIIGKSGEFKIVEEKVGSMLGRGIYLADKTSKSAMYISDDGYGMKGDQGTMMICDAILGLTSEYENDDADTVEALSGVGKWSSLRNNEWCVKDPKAVRPRYMIHMEV